MKLDANAQLSRIAIAIASLALVCSLFTAFPGLKGMFSVVRDGVPWLAMLLILSGAGFVVFQRLQQSPALTQRSGLADLSGRAPAPHPMIPELRP